MMKIYLAISVLLILACTNPFSTREPELPAITIQPQSANSLQNHPDSLLAKLRYSFLEKNRFYYRELFADSATPGVNNTFDFVASQGERVRMSGWNRQDELNYFEQLSSNPEIISKQLIIDKKNQEWEPVSGSQDQLQNSFSYQINIQYQNKSEIYKGQSIFQILRSSQSLWYIYHWEDLPQNADQSEGTWSTLKANYR